MATFNALAKRTAMDLFVSTLRCSKLSIYEEQRFSQLTQWQDLTPQPVRVLSRMPLQTLQLQPAVTADSAKLIAGSNEITLSCWAGLSARGNNV